MPSVSKAKIYDCAVVGGGVSGLAAAVALAQFGASVLILEQAPRLGGRCYSYRDVESGDIVENGQHLLIGAYQNTLRYLELVGTRKYLRERSGFGLPLIHPEKGVAEFRMSALPKPLNLTTGIFRFTILSLNERSLMLAVGLFLQQWNKKKEEMLRSESVERWLITLGQSAEARRSFWDPIAVSIMNEAPERASALLFARTLRAAFLGKRSDSSILVPTVGQTELYVDGAEKLFQQNDVEVRTSSGVEKVLTKKGIVSGVSLIDGTVIPARAVIASVPHHALGRLLQGATELQDDLARLQQIGSSPIISIHLWFDRQFMDHEFVGLIGASLHWVFDRRKIVSDRGRHPGYVSAVISAAYAFVNLSKEELAAIALRDLHCYLPESRNARLLASIVIKEKRATFSPLPEAEGARLRTKTQINGLYLAGDWTDTKLPGTIEGAIQSGFAAAEYISNNVIRRTEG